MDTEELPKVAPYGAEDPIGDSVGVAEIVDGKKPTQEPEESTADGAEELKDSVGPAMDIKDGRTANEELPEVVADGVPGSKGD